MHERMLELTLGGVPSGLAYASAMAVLNTWRGSRGAGGELNVYLQCDACLPGTTMAGTASSLAGHGWRFRDLLDGPHLCPACAYRGRAGGERVRRSPPSDRPGLPNLLIIGATKAGTTALHTYLGLHPEIRMSEDKELDFFGDPNCLERLDEYASFFDAESPMRGESSPTYTYSPRLQGVPHRIRAAVPDAKLIYIVRDPVERALSHYVYYSALWDEVPIEEAFADLEDPHHLYLAPSRYAHQLALYLEVFPPEQIKVIDQAHLLDDGPGAMHELFQFLGVGAEVDVDRFDEVINPASGRRRMSRAGRWLRASGISAGARYLPARPRETLISWTSRLMSRRARPSPQPSLELRERLRAALAGDAARLRELTGLELAGWQV
jgi:hypothetical protein